MVRTCQSLCQEIKNISQIQEAKESNIFYLIMSSHHLFFQMDECQIQVQVFLMKKLNN